MIDRKEKGILVNVFKMLFVSWFTTSSARFSEFDSWKVIIFQVIVFGRNTKDTTLVKHFSKVNVRPCVTRLRVTKQKNIVH